LDGRDDSIPLSHEEACLLQSGALPPRSCSTLLEGMEWGSENQSHQREALEEERS
ncbi:hypothetical protein P7K49_006250, partial [Saguinus oedipus]